MSTTTSRRDALLADVRTAHQDLLQAGRSFSADDWRRGTYEGWTVKDLFAHLCTIETRQRDQVQAALAGQPYAPKVLSVDDYNEACIAERRSWSPEQVLAESESEAAVTEGLLASLSDADLEKSFQHPRRGQLTVAYLFGHMPDHIKEHTKAMTGQESAAKA